jgi:uncharacterized protein
VFRRALENVDPGIATLGFAGFFGLPLSHLAQGSDVAAAHLPVLLTPRLTTTGQADPDTEHDIRIRARTRRAWGRCRQAAVFSFAFVEAAGTLYAGKLLRDGHGRFVLLLGHGGQVTNNPHESAHHCGVRGGQTGEVSARLLATLLNDPETRAGLPARGITLPPDSLFIAGLHDMTTDKITLHDVPTDDPEIARLRHWLGAAGRIAPAERAATLPGATPDTIAARAPNWAETRPEWGLAGCAAFIAAPRASTAGKRLDGRTFLHSYTWQDDDGFATLDLILTAPVVVASWISLQFYGSSVAPDVFGGGNKLIHNVTGVIGVTEGNGGCLHPGLPRQAVHDGARLMHDPLRLAVLIEAPSEAITDILARHDSVRALFDKGWLHLLRMRDGRVTARYRPGLAWEPVLPA